MEAFSIVAALATAVQALALIVLHVLPTGYGPVSDYGVGPYQGWFWLQAVAGGVGCLALAIALAKLHPLTPTQAVVALLVAGVARLLISFFATDQGGSRFQTVHGTIHMILAVIAFGGLMWAATGLWSTLSHYPAWHRAQAALTIIPRVMLGSVIAVVLAIRGPRFEALLRGLRAPALPVLDHLGPDRRHQSRPDVRLTQPRTAISADCEPLVEGGAECPP